MATHKDSRRQEKRTAKKTGCKVHSGSGNKQVKDDMSLDGGDEVNRIRIETKITSNSEFRVPLRDFEETARRARMFGQVPVWKIEFKLTGSVYWLTVQNLLGHEGGTGAVVLIADRQRAICLRESDLSTRNTQPLVCYIHPALSSLAVYREEDALGILKQR